MPYHDCITQNLALFCSPGVNVTLVRAGKSRVQFRIKSGDHSFCLLHDWPAIFAFEENAPQLRKFFAGAHQISLSR